MIPYWLLTGCLQVKYDYFIALKYSYSARIAVYIFARELVWILGIPISIVK